MFELFHVSLKKIVENRMRKLIYSVVLSVSLTLSSHAFAEEETVVADFNSGEMTNNLGGEIEIWLAGDGNDPTQFSKMSFVSDDALGNTAGKSIRIDYDVDSENPAYNGVRTNLHNFDTAGYQTLSFYIKGDSTAGFTEILKIELIGESGEPSPTMVNGITGEWQKITIPLSDFPMIKEGSKLQKFVVVFADINNDLKVGTIYLDHVSFNS